MISVADIEALRERPSTPQSPVLSVYLEVDQSRAANLNGRFTTALDARLRSLADSLPPGEREAFRADAERARRFVAHYEPRAKTLIAFADESADLLWSGDLHIPIATDARWEPTAYLRPLLEAIDEHPRYGVILIDKDHARLLTVRLGEVEEERAALASHVVRHKQASGTDHWRSQMQFQRQDDTHVQWHVRQVGEIMDELERTFAFARLIVAGPVEATSELVRELPHRLAERVAATIRLPVDAAADEVLALTMPIAERIERDAEQAAVARLFERGVLGLEPTLEALQEGRVQALLYAEGLAARGGQCLRCGVLAVDGEDDTCGYCGGPRLLLDDVVPRSVERARDTGAAVAQVRGDAALRLRAAGGIGGIVRF